MISSIDWKILVIDDEKDIRDIVSLVLSDAGFEVATAGDGIEGIRVCSTILPQIVLTDIRMPKMDGLQVLETLKKDFPQTEVIVMTAFREMDQAIKALELDASDYITKPLSDDVLFIALKRAQNRYLYRQQPPNGPPSAQSFQENLVNGSIDGALACDANETIIAMNPAMAEMIGFSEKEIINQANLSRLFPADQKARVDKELLHEDSAWENRISV